MNESGAQNVKNITLPFWSRGPIIVWLLLGLIPVSCKIFFGIQYIPSLDWVTQVYIPATISGTIMAVFTIWAVVRGIAIRYNGMGKLMKFVVILLTPFMGFGIGSNAVTMGGPMIVTVFNGNEVEIPFTVTRIMQISDRKCPNPISLNDGLPLMFDKLCGFSEQFGRSLEVGGHILVVGQGTKMGVFVKSAHRLD